MVDTSCILAQQFAFQSMLAGSRNRFDAKTLAPEYAKCKNRPCDLTSRKWSAAMTDDPSKLASPSKPDSPAPRERELPPAAQRALAEAEARRKAAAADAASRPKEFQGPKGPEPTRYGDWESKGIASDF
jgi:hypothetical protein